MQNGKIKRCVFALGVAGLLNGCVPNAGYVKPVSVKSITADPEGYASREFTSTSIPDQVRKAVVANDNKPVGFSRLVMDTSTDGTNNGVAGVSHYTNHGIYKNEGNGLISSVDTLSSNGIQTSISMDITYRHLLALSQQSVSLSAVNAGRPIQVELLSHLDTPLSGQKMNFSYDYGYQGQTRNFIHGETNCVFGSTYKASDINLKISGTARNLDCQNINQNGVVTSNTHVAYLDNYGFGVLLKRSTSTSNVSFTVTEFKVD